MSLRSLSCGLLSSIALVAQMGCEKPFLHELPEPLAPNDDAPPAPVVVLEAIEPDIARDGTELSVSFTTNVEATDCFVALAEQAGSCDAPVDAQGGSRCVCTVQVAAAVPEGRVTLTASAKSTLGATGSVDGAVDVDRTPPVVDGARVAIERAPLGVDDVLGVEPGALNDPGPVYEEQAVVRLRVWGSLDAEDALLEADVVDAATKLTLSLSGTDVTGHRQLWLSALDAVGNEAERVEVIGGKDVEGPVLDVEGAEIVRRPLGERDRVRFPDGAAQDEVSALAVVRIFAAEAGGSPVATADVTAAGAVAEVPVGEPGSSFRRLFAEAVDKNGNVGARVEILGGADTDGPVGDATRLRVERAPLGEPDGAAGDAGAFVDGTSAVARVRLFDVPVGGEALADVEVGADGSFVTSLGDTEEEAPPRLFAAGVDKNGNVGARVEILVGQDLDGPVVDGALSTLTRDDAGAAVSGAPGSVVDATSAIREVRIYTEEGTTPLAVAAASDEGGFAAIALDDPPLRLELEAVDKAGNASSRVLVARAELTFSAAEASPVPGGPSARLYAWAADEDPRSAVAGLARLVAAPLTAAELGAVDSAALTTEASAADDVADEWSLEPAAGPTARLGGAMAFEPAGGQLWLFGGRDATNTLLGDLWRHDGSVWSTSTTDPAPLARDAAAFAWDAGAGRGVLLGGLRAGSTCDDDTAFCGDVWLLEQGAWSELAIESAERPLGRFAHALAYDARRDVVVLFGGDAGGAVCSVGSTLCADTWELDGATWRRVETQASPFRRSGHAMAYDAARGRAVLFGGDAGDVGVCQVSSPLCGDTWEYDGETWVQVTPPVAPSPRAGHAMAYDAARGRVLLFGGAVRPGTTCSGSSRFCDDVWEWDGQTWTELAVSDAQGDGAPGPRALHALAYDAARGDVVVFGGGQAQGTGETWRLRGHVAHPRFASQAWFVPMEPGAELLGASVEYVGAGSGSDGAGGLQRGVELLAWNAESRAWVSLGTHTASELAAPVERQLAAPLPGDASDFVGGDGVWLLAVPLAAALPGDATTSRLDTDFWSITLRYEL